MAGMSDQEVQGQMGLDRVLRNIELEAEEKMEELDVKIAHMIAFIDQEASEKVEEIDAKAEEEFNLEKGRLVQTARAKIIDFYDKKIKQVELQKKIQQSNLLNNSRLQVLKRKEELVNDVLEEARKTAAALPSQDQQKYRKTMIDLTCQALAQLLEPKVKVQVKQKDLDLMKSIVPEISEIYKKMTKGREVKLAIDEENFLSPDLIGGLILFVHGDKITINNTLDERLKLISNEMQPQLREMLFGSNPNRKFKD